jgi:hypothetical protein
MRDESLRHDGTSNEYSLQQGWERYINKQKVHILSLESTCPILSIRVLQHECAYQVSILNVVKQRNFSPVPSYLLKLHSKIFAYAGPLCVF